MVRESKWILCGDCGKNHWSDELCTGDHAPPPPAVPAPQQGKASLEDVPLNKDALFAATRFARHLLDANCKDTPFDVAKHSHYCGQLEGARREREKQGHATRTAFCQKLEIADLAEVIAKKDAEIARLNGELGVIGYVSADGARIKKLHDEITHLRSDLDIAREALRRAGEAMPDWDCGSNSCRFAKIKGGMRTNGGCTCLEEIRNAPKARMAFARIASVLSTLTTKESK